MDSNVTNVVTVLLPPFAEQAAYFWNGFDSGCAVFGSIGAIWGLIFAFKPAGFLWKKE
jgi:hypothetical protein